MKFFGILFDLEIRETSIEEAAELKKVTVETVKRNLRELGFSMRDFRMWKEFKREKERLIRLCMNNMLSEEEFGKRYSWLKDEETTEGGKPVNGLYETEDPEGQQYNE